MSADTVLAIERAAQTPTTGQVTSALQFVGYVVGIPVAILVVTYLASRFASHRLRGALNRGGLPLNVSILVSRTLWATIWALGVLWIVHYFGAGFGPLAAFIGVLGLAASLSLQTVLQNLVAGVYLLVERPFAIGDTILVVGPNGVNHEGRVEDVEMRTTHLRSADDELILVPNAAIFSGVVTNRTAVGGYASQASLTFPRDVQPDAVREQLSHVVFSVPAVLSQPAPILRVDKIGKDSWTGTLSFWVTTRDAVSGVTWAIADAFPAATVNEGVPA